MIILMVCEFIVQVFNLPLWGIFLPFILGFVGLYQLSKGLK